MERVKITDTAGNPLDLDALRTPAGESDDEHDDHDHDHDHDH
jgi:trigger factor